MIALRIGPSISRIHPRELCCGSAVDTSRGIRRAVERGIVTHDDNTVGRQVHVQLQPVGACCQPTLERGHRVLRAKRASAPVREHPGTQRPLEEGHD